MCDGESLNDTIHFRGFSLKAPKPRIIDNEKYKKWFYIEIIIMLGVSGLGGILYLIDYNNPKITAFTILSVLITGIIIGIVLSWFLQSMYVKKQKTEITK